MPNFPAYRLLPVRARPMVETKDGHALYLDSTHNSAPALMHENSFERCQRARPALAQSISMKSGVLSPVDLIVSKIACYNGQIRKILKP